MNLNFLTYGIAFGGLIIASFIDIKKHRIPDWLTFGLLWTALILKLTDSFNLFFQGITGAFFIFLFSFIFYGAKSFGGGDKKLLISLGAIIPVYTYLPNTFILESLFLILFIITSAIYFVIAKGILKKENFAFGPCFLISFGIFTLLMILFHSL